MPHLVILSVAKYPRILGKKRLEFVDSSPVLSQSQNDKSTLCLEKNLLACKNSKKFSLFHAKIQNQSEIHKSCLKIQAQKALKALKFKEFKNSVPRLA